MKTTKILLIALVIMLFTNCTPLITKKIQKTYTADTEQECNSKNGYWYKGKCWANFKEIDTGINKDSIDNVVERQLKLIENATISVNKNRYHIHLFEVEFEKEALFITVYTVNQLQKSIVQFVNMKKLKPNKNFTTTALLFNGNIMGSSVDEPPIAKGSLICKFTDFDKLDFHFKGTIKSEKDVFNIDFVTNEALLGAGSSKLVIKGNQAFLNGDLGTITYKQIKELITKHKNIKTLVFENVPGSVNDEVNMFTGKMIRDAGLTTKLLANSDIASGGVDLFCSGKNRIITKGAKLGVHSWNAMNFSGEELPKDHPAHQYQVEYFNMCLGEKGEDFYFYTLNAASANNIYYMKQEELEKWGLASKFVKAPNPKGFPDLPENLGYYYGNSESNTVIINTQGGPEIELFTKEFEEIFTEYGKLNKDSFFVVNINQIQIIHPEKFTKNDISFEQAKSFDNENTELLANAVKYFKSKNKKVIVTGLSYGAFMVEDLLAQYGNIADSYLISVGRLDIPEKVWKLFSKGKQLEFKDGVNTTRTYKSPDVTDRNMPRLAAGYGYKRYTQLLKDVNMSNVVYVYGMKDDAVGRLTKDEIIFLKAKNVRIIKGEKGHEETMFGLLEKGLKAVINNAR